MQRYGKKKKQMTRCGWRLAAVAGAAIWLVLPGCVTWGETRAEAAIMAEDAVQGWLMTALRFGDEVPILDDYCLGYLMDTNAAAEVAYA